MIPSSRRSTVTAGSVNEIGRSGAPFRAVGTTVLDFALMSGGLHIWLLRPRNARIWRFACLALGQHRDQRFHQQPGLKIGLGESSALPARCNSSAVNYWRSARPIA